MAKKPKKKAPTYSIGEWYGYLFKSLGAETRQKYAEYGGTKSSVEPCPFRAANPDLAPQNTTLCTKKGGVCSIRLFEDPGEGKFGPLVATCPSRFYEGGLIVEAVAKLVLETDAAQIVKEVPFLRRTDASEAEEAAADEAAAAEQAQDAAEAGREDVGRIDMVVVDAKDVTNWCALEIQAVYFSGKSMTPEYAYIRDYKGQGIPEPVGGRHPDFRSSGPKRLMPQLQTKVPTLRRWGKKMVVVVDDPFIKALGPMGKVSHISNSDIVWVVVDYKEDPGATQAKLYIKDTVCTTLERAVEGLTAGFPVTEPEFQTKIEEKLKEKSLKPKTKSLSLEDL